jgi:outer membrane lipoprotein-sorting protein
MNDKNIEEILKEVAAENIPADVHKIAEDVSRDFTKTLTQRRQPKHYVLGDYIMKSRLTKLAVAAAVIIVVVLSGLPFLGKKGSGIALADVLAKVEQSRAFMYKMKMTITGNITPGMPAGKQEMEGAITISNEYGMKMEMDMTDPNTGKKTTQQMYVLPDQKVILAMMPEMKQYMRMELNDDLLARVKKQNNDPREMIKRIMSCKYTEMGQSVIDGVKVDGFQTTDPVFTGGAAMGNVKLILWVDVESWLPVRTEMDLRPTEQMQMHCVIYDYQWDIPVDASEFKPVIPQDYTTILPGGYKLPSGSEEEAIEGLRFCEQLIGRYPKKIDMMNLMNEIVGIKDSNNPTEAALKFKEELKEEMDKLPEEEKAKKIMDIMRPAQSLGMFYMTLVQDKKEPVYYGESVTSADVDKALLRWKMSDSEYRVIFGDLRAETVTPEKLAELEGGLPK